MLRCRLIVTRSRLSPTPLTIPARALFGFAKKQYLAPPPSKATVLSQDDLFHPFSQSPIAAIQERGNLIRTLAPCPVCLDVHEERRPVQFECPDCGWPTHSSEEHWKSDLEHSKYCSRLREANEDEHDLRSGRRLAEYELPGRISLSSTLDVRR
jgi:mitochondrial splicing suppressor protein 51